MNNKKPGYCDICGLYPVVDKEVAEQHPETTYICGVCLRKYVEKQIKKSEE